MDIEIGTESILAHTRGRSNLSWLRPSGLTRGRHCARLIILTSQVSRLNKASADPSAVAAAFERPADIGESWAHELSQVLEDPQRRAPICAHARAIAAVLVRREPREILRQLLSASAPGRKWEAATLRSGHRPERAPSVQNSIPFQRDLLDAAGELWARTVSPASDLPLRPF